MKQFDKWLKENDWRNYLYSEEDAAKEGWKAALECVLSTFNRNIELSDLDNTYDIIDVYNMIEKELEE